jgi:Glycosyltransferase family 87
MPNQPRGGMPVFPWGLLGLVTVPLGILAVVTYFRIFPPIFFGDAEYYATALPALTGNAPLYSAASLQPHVLPPPPFWDQAPSTALFASILLLPGREVVWGLLLVACVVAGIAILMPPLGGGVVLYAPVVTALPVVLEGTAWGNLNALVFLMIAIAWRWPRHAGWAIGIAAAAKVLPVLLVAWLIGRRDWPGVMVALAIPAAFTGVVVLLTSPSILGDFVRVRLNQQMIPGWRIGLADLGVPPIVAWLIALVVASVAARKASFSLAVLATLLVAPALYLHYWLYALVPALGIWVPWLIRRGDRRPAHGSTALLERSRAPIRAP